MTTLDHTGLRLTGALRIEHLATLSLHVGVNDHGWAVVEGEAGENALEQLQSAVAGREQIILMRDETGAEEWWYQRPTTAIPGCGLDFQNGHLPVRSQRTAIRLESVSGTMNWEVRWQGMNVPIFFTMMCAAVRVVTWAGIQYIRGKNF